MTPLILIVEDDKHTLSLFQTLLGRSGFRTHSATTVQEAHQQILQERPAIILLDLGLPGASGLDLLQLVQNDTHLSPIKVIVISAYNNLIKRAQQVGADAYLYKPINATYLLNLLHEMLAC